jgi:phenylpyruvate tautomerase
MPLLKLETSVALDKEKKSSLLSSLSKIVAQDTGKPEGYVMVVIRDDASIMMAKKECAAAFVDIRGIGGLNSFVNKKLSQNICSLLYNQIGVSPEAVYLNFTEFVPENWGFNNTTF